MYILYILLLIQAALAAVLCFGDIGFDHGGKYGLDFDDGVKLLAFYALALLLGLVVAFMRGRYWWLGAQFLPILFYILHSSLPAPHFDASHYQSLVGKSKAELVREIGSPRGAVTGFQGGRGLPDEEFMNLRGMTVFISSNGTVVRVESNNR